MKNPTLRGKTYVETCDVMIWSNYLATQCKKCLDTFNAPQLTFKDLTNRTYFPRRHLQLSTL